MQRQSQTTYQKAQDKTSIYLVDVGCVLLWSGSVGAWEGAGKTKSRRSTKSIESTSINVDMCRFDFQFPDYYAAPRTNDKRLVLLFFVFRHIPRFRLNAAARFIIGAWHSHETRATAVRKSCRSAFPEEEEEKFRRSRDCVPASPGPSVGPSLTRSIAVKAVTITNHQTRSA